MEKKYDDEDRLQALTRSVVKSDKISIWRHILEGQNSTRIVLKSLSNLSVKWVYTVKTNRLFYPIQVDSKHFEAIETRGDREYRLTVTPPSGFHGSVDSFISNWFLKSTQRHYKRFLMLLILFILLSLITCV